ncbi:DUF7402 domain-containing protein [Sporomusa sphaeroides]|uniref:GlcNAc-PI de-N-acetylase n=1 Tax=Sporomusa sphaeroides DSM 2875 TaxID=1337886 RepID=A0ABP2C6C6_9FIRM|nr:PIG-L family deacetylase [Sporomusa sphaeroides]OLS55523.1 GlcNAc-PI de-N-acetylase [Sporomusa sphaeroides DSM 2875]CVK19940.1 GlcNAc-PI de-N-acetylase [Sporomusa sphaeroides DSM 2875]
MLTIFLVLISILLVGGLVYFKYRQQTQETAYDIQPERVLFYDFTNPNLILSRGKKILVLAPHEDDEALMCSGIIEHALTNGADIKVAVISNGDKKGRKAGLTRIRETLKAMEYLGLPSSNIIFLGYGDTEKNSNSFMNKLYNAETDTTVVSSYVDTQTYSTPETPEYHYQKHGVHGTYNRATFRQDMEEIIEECRPDYIFVTSLYDTHPDHFMLYKFTVESIIHLKRNNPEFSPIMYEYLIHSHDGDDHWPARNPKNGFLTPFSKPNTLDTHTLLDWEKREIFLLPMNMQKVPLLKNKKYITISKYRSQKPAANNKYLYSYVKRDEIFWKKDFSNIACLANVSVSSENESTNQLGIKAIDGIADGYPRFPTNEWATKGETSGAWIQLSWLQTYTINKIVLYDRPNLNDHITGAVLTFSDGSLIKTGPLPNNGSACEISFSAKKINWFKLTVESAEGSNVGLAEIEVYEEKNNAN